jgi:hypothetical protein
LWNNAADGARRQIERRFTTADARRIFKISSGEHTRAEGRDCCVHRRSRMESTVALISKAPLPDRGGR